MYIHTYTHIIYVHTPIRYQQESLDSLDFKFPHPHRAQNRLSLLKYEDFLFCSSGTADTLPLLFLRRSLRLKAQKYFIYRGWHQKEKAAPTPGGRLK